MSRRRYLGDGAYADYDGHFVVLTTSDGASDTNVIYLEPDVLASLENFIADVKKHAAGDDAPAPPAKAFHCTCGWSKPPTSIPCGACGGVAVFRG